MSVGAVGIDISEDWEDDCRAAFAPSGSWRRRGRGPEWFEIRRVMEPDRPLVRLNLEPLRPERFEARGML